VCGEDSRADAKDFLTFFLVLFNNQPGGPFGPVVMRSFSEITRRYDWPLPRVTFCNQDISQAIALRFLALFLLLLLEGKLVW